MQGVDRPTACHQYLCTTILQRKNEEVKDYTACLLLDTDISTKTDCENLLGYITTGRRRLNVSPPTTVVIIISSHFYC